VRRERVRVRWYAPIAKYMRRDRGREDRKIGMQGTGVKDHSNEITGWDTGEVVAFLLV
jgi:hypothetical protein